MRVIILAGGLGTRLAEETSVRPKPMVEIGGKPILWHIMNIYASAGFKDFLVACGYKGEMIREYFHNFLIHNSDLIINLRDGSCKVINSNSPDWQVGLIDTGLTTLTGGRLRWKALAFVDDRRMDWNRAGDFESVLFNQRVHIDVRALVDFHRSHGKLATVTAVSPVARFGSLILHGNVVSQFCEKPQTGEGWINGGFFVFEPAVLDYIGGDQTSLEREPLERLAAEGQLMAFRHANFWHPMDTLRDKQFLDVLWTTGKAPWKMW